MKKSPSYISEPILKINEFEEAARAILDLAKDQSLRNIQEAKDKAAQIIQKQKETLPHLEKEYLEKIEEELKMEKEKLLLKSKDNLELIENIPSERAKHAVRYVLERILPEGV